MLILIKKHYHIKIRRDSFKIHYIKIEDCLLIICFQIYNDLTNFVELTGYYL